MNGNAENRVLKRVGTKKIQMKKLFLSLTLGILISGVTRAQFYDDGFVTNGLPVNTTDEKFAAYVKELTAGMDKVMNGQITSNDQVIQAYGVDLLSFPKLEEVVATSNWSVYGEKYSPAYLRELESVIGRTTVEYNSLYEIRNALRSFPSRMNLSAAEAESLAAIDISLQETGKRLLTSMTGTSWKKGTSFYSFFSLAMMSPLFVSQSTSTLANYNYIKLPGWVKCAFGVISEAILGGFSGVKIGSIIGGPVGAAVVGIAGVLGGAFKGAAQYC
jgi:hypothetical protein